MLFAAVPSLKLQKKFFGCKRLLILDITGLGWVHKSVGSSDARSNLLPGSSQSSIPTISNTADNDN